MSIQALLLPENVVEQRREERWLVKFHAALHDQDGKQHRLNIFDLSADGFLMESPQRLPVNACLVVQMPSGTYKICKTVWSRGKRHGVVFSDPLSAIELDSLIATQIVAHQPLQSARGSHLQLCQVPSEVAAQTTRPNEEKYPRAFRLLIATGASAGLWGIIGVALWQAIV